MERTEAGGVDSPIAEFDTPFADISSRSHEASREAFPGASLNATPEYESPFLNSFDAGLDRNAMTSARAGEIVNFLGELHSDAFGQQLYEMALELEERWDGKISDEIGMGERFVPFATQEAEQYFDPLLRETTKMIERVGRQFSGNNFADFTDSEVDRFFETIEGDHAPFSPAQEQFFGSLFKKIKSVVKKGVDLAKKGVSVLGKFLPISMILEKLKAMIKPLLEKVLRFAIGKLPQTLQPYAQTLAKKLLNLEIGGEVQTRTGEIPTTGSLEAVQAEFDNHLAQLVFSPGEMEAGDVVGEYETSSASLDRHDLLYETTVADPPTIDAARRTFINELKQLKPGESPAPAIEHFLPALQPIIKLAISIIGRPKIVNFLANLLAKLVAKYVPPEVARPLATSIVDLGLGALGFETAERNGNELAYEAIANTIQETMQNLSPLSEAMVNDQDALTAETLEAFEKAAANNFPPGMIKESKRLTSEHGTWVMMPRTGGRHRYKKFTRSYDVTLDSRMASALTTFRGVPLTHFLKDKLGLDLSQPVTAHVHLYEAIHGTTLYRIARSEHIPGLGDTGRFGYLQLHPLTVQAASLLLKEPHLGRDFPAEFTTRRHHTAIGQRFYYLEIPGAHLKVVSVPTFSHAGHHAAVAGEVPQQAQAMVSAVPHSNDIQGVLNFVRSEIKINYYLSELDALTVAERLNAGDYSGAFMSIQYSVRHVLHGILLRNIGSKVKIVHEALPEMFLENVDEKQEQFSWSSIGSSLRSVAINAGKEILHKLVERLANKISDGAYLAVVNYFKTRVKEFIAAQSAPQDGVTISVVWSNVPGMAGIGAIINAAQGKLSLGGLSELTLPSLPAPEVKIVPGKQFD